MKSVLVATTLLASFTTAVMTEIVPPVTENMRYNRKGYRMSVDIHADDEEKLSVTMDTTVPWDNLAEGNMIQQYVQFLDNERSLPDADFYDVVGCSGLFSTFKTLD